MLTVVGDGSSLYQIQALWSAAAYDVGVLFIVLRNGGYAIMNRLAERAGGDGPWPALETIDIAAMARAQGCAALTITDHATLLETLDELLPALKTARARCCSRSPSPRTSGSIRTRGHLSP